MRIILVPQWMGDFHWLLMMVAFGALAFWCWLLFRNAGNIRSMLHAIIWTSATGICFTFWLIQTALLPIDPMYLFAIERAFWWPMAFAAAVLVDIHAAQLNGHRSLITRLDKYIQKARKNGYSSE